MTEAKIISVEEKARSLAFDIWVDCVGEERAAFILSAEKLIAAVLRETVAEAKKPLIEALTRVAGHEGMTNLAGCCVTKTCTGHYEDGERVAYCAFQFGVMRGFNECASEAKSALQANGSA